ncbi:MAG: ABC transporter ATP-binding protein [Magnetococcales bacterium]|nr:ABC transporter ATP-binding protein [Magnetococcales bacterium]
MDTALTIKNIAVQRGGKSILNDVNLTVTAGSCCGLVGLNGAGKSTLIHAVLDLLPTRQGAVTLFDIPWTDPASREQLAYLPERYRFSDRFTGADMLRGLLRFHGVVWQYDAVVSMLNDLGLSEVLLKKPLGQLSKGTVQRLGLASIFLSQRKLLILDEPMSGLDPLARSCFRAALKNYQQGGGTIFFNTHLLHDVNVLCDHMAILHEGTIVFDGAPDSCQEQFGADTLESAFLKIIKVQLSSTS